MVLCVGDGCRCIRAYRGFDGSAPRGVLHGKVQASNEKKTDAQRERADKQGDENRRNNSEFYRRRTLVVEA